MAKKKYVNVFTVLLAVISPDKKDVAYHTEVVEGHDTPSKATAVAKAKHEKGNYTTELVTCFVGAPRIVTTYEYKKVPIEKASCAFVDMDSADYFITNDEVFLSEMEYNGIVDLLGMLDDPCLADSLTEGTVTVKGIQEVINFFGAEGETPGGIKCSFLKECLAKPNIEYRLLKDCPTMVNYGAEEEAVNSSK